MAAGLAREASEEATGVAGHSDPPAPPTRNSPPGSIGGYEKYGIKTSNCFPAVVVDAVPPPTKGKSACS